MKHKILAILVPVLASAAVVGTGFAAWQFTGSSGSMSVSSVQLGSANSIGNITVQNATQAQLVMDSNSSSGILLKYGQGATGSPKEDRIDFSFTLTSQADVTLKTTIVMPPDLGAYVSLEAENHNTSNNSSLGTNHTQTMSSQLSWDDTITNASGTMNLYTDLDFTWVSGKEPQDYSAYTNLKGIVDGLSGQAALSVTYSLSFA